MSFDAHANFGYTTVTAAPAPAASGTSITVSDASVFPAAPFNATVWATGEIPVATNAEIVRVTAVVGNVLTITRAQELSVARSILVGDQIANTITVKVVTDIEAAIPSTAGLLSAVNVSAGATSANLSALTFDNSNGVSFGLTNGIITGTVATNYQSQGAYLTTAALSQDSSKYAGTNGAITGGSLTVNTSGISINLPAYLTTAMQSNAVTLSNAKFSGGTLSALRSDLTFGDSNGISFGLNTNGVLTGTVATNYQSAGAYLTTAALSQDSSKYAGTNGAITGGSITVNTSGVSVNLPAYLSTQSTQYLAVTLGGNTAGTTTFNASDNATIFLHGGNNITLSGNGASITISGPNAGGAQTGISGIVVSDTTYTSGTVSFSNAGNITIASSVNGATQYIKLSGNAAQTTQSAIKAFGVSNTGQTAGNTGVSTGIDWVLAGSNSITLSQSTAGGGPNTVWIQHPAWLTTAMQSNAVTLSNIKVSAGANSANLSAFTLSDSNGISFGLNGSTITGSHNALTSQSTQFLALTLGGNTAGTTTFNASNNATIFLHGGNNITLSGNGSSVTISGANAGGAQTAISGIIVSDATYTSGTVSFSNAGNITISSSVNGATQYIRLSGNAAQTTQSAIKGFGVSNTGATAGNTGISTGVDWVLAGSNLLTLSQSTAAGVNTVWIQHPAWLTTAMASNRGSDFVAATAGFNGTNASGTIASNSWSVSVAAPIPIATAVKAVSSVGSTGTITRYAPEDHQHAGVAAFAVTNTGNTLGNTRSQVGTFYLAASGAITASQSTAAAGNDTVWLSVAAQSNQSAIKGFGVSNTGQTAGNTGLSTGIDWVLAGSNSITLSQSTAGGGPNTVWIQHPAWLTTAMASNRGSDFVAATAGFNGTNASGTMASNSWSVSVAAQTNQTIGGYALGNTTGQSSSTTWDARTVSINGAGNVSVGYSAGSLVISGGTAAPSPVNFSAGTTSGNLGSVVFSNSNGVSFGLNGSTVTATVSTYDTVGTATTVYSVASANSVGTVTRWAAEDHRHAGIGGFGISTAGNTLGTTGSNVGTVWLQGNNAITLSQITSNNGSHTIVVMAPTPGTLSMWPDVLPGSTAVSTYYSGSTSQGAGGASTQTGYTFSLYAVPMPLPAAVAFSELRIGVSNGTNAGTGSVTHMYSAGIYSNNASTLSLVSGFYGGLVLSQNSQTAQTYSVFTASTAGATSGAGGGMAGISKASVYSSQGNVSANSQIFGRMQFMPLASGASGSLSAGQYYMVFGNATASSGVNALSQVGVLQSDAIQSQAIPDLGRENSTQTSNYLPAWGAISTTFTSVSNAANFFALPNAIPIANMSLSSSAWQRFHFPVMRNLS